MDLAQALILSAVEGVTEFLPVSSTGHLVLASDLLKIPQTEFVKSFEIFIQLGAILAVIVLYLPKLVVFRNKKDITFDAAWISPLIDPNVKTIVNWKAILNVSIAFIPTAIIGLVLYKFIKNYLLGNTLVVIAALFVGGIFLIVLEKLHKEKQSSHSAIEQLSMKQSLMIGLAQSISVVPGVSRSAATILGGMFSGLKRETAVEFSFLLAVPTMLAATALDLLKSDFRFTNQEFTILATGFIGAFITALIVIKWFVKYVQKNSFFWFGVYRIVLAAGFFLIYL